MDALKLMMMTITVMLMALTTIIIMRLFTFTENATDY